MVSSWSPSARSSSSVSFAFDKNGIAKSGQRSYGLIMTTDEIKGLPIEQKLRIMKALWEDLRERFEQSEIPERHKKLLDQRRERVRTGQARLLDWDSVKGTIGRT